MIRTLEATRIQCDLMVIGGGIAGCCAAVAASRLGLNVALVNNRPVLGGNGSSEVGLLIGSADRDFPHAREGGVAEEINLLNRFYNHEVQWRNSISDATLEHLVLDAGVRLFLNVHVDSVDVSDSAAIEAVAGSQQGTERRFTFESDYYVDSTGDGTIAALSEAPWRSGSEAKSEFNEPHAPEEPTTTTMGSTLMFRIKDLGRPVPFIRPPWAYEYKSPDDLPVKIRGHLEYPQLWIEFGAHLDTIGQNDEIRTELQKILFGVWDHIKNHGDYNAENMVLSWAASVPGKRESRRIEGNHILTENDVVTGTTFDDAVAYGGWPIDVHNAEGFYAREKWTDYLHLAKPYQIPLRCYYSRSIHNLFMAGRAISTTHIAHGTTRLMGTCGAGGQAVGTAAFVCMKHGLTAHELDPTMIQELQQILLKYDAHIPGLRNEDPDDLARAANVWASSEYVDPVTSRAAAATNVIEGVSRGSEDNENMWISKPFTRHFPAFIQLDWGSPVELSVVHLTFDTMMRQQRMFDRFILGPMSTCVRDYRLLIPDGEENWREVASVKGNFLRHNVLALERVKTRTLRVQVDRTNGDELVRIYEIRAYR